MGIDPSTKKAIPLIKTMYIRDPSKKKFNVTKYDHAVLASDPVLAEEAYGDITYDERLFMKQHLFEKLMCDLRVYFAEEELILKEEMVRALTSEEPEYKLFNITKEKHIV